MTAAPIPVVGLTSFLASDKTTLLWAPATRASSVRLRDVA